MGRKFRDTTQIRLYVAAKTSASTVSDACNPRALLIVILRML